MTLTKRILALALAAAALAWWWREQPKRKRVTVPGKGTVDLATDRELERNRTWLDDLVEKANDSPH